MKRMWQGIFRLFQHHEHFHIVPILGTITSISSAPLPDCISYQGKLKETSWIGLIIPVWYHEWRRYLKYYYGVVQMCRRIQIYVIEFKTNHTNPINFFMGCDCSDTCCEIKETHFMLRLIADHLKRAMLVWSIKWLIPILHVFRGFHVLLVN